MLNGRCNPDAILFNDSIFNNIALGIENPDQKKLLKQQKLPMRTSLFQNLKTVTSTILVMEDINCLVVRSNASVLHEQYENPPILILDEATRIRF